MKDLKEYLLCESKIQFIKKFDSSKNPAEYNFPEEWKDIPAFLDAMFNWDEIDWDFEYVVDLKNHFTKTACYEILDNLAQCISEFSSENKKFKKTAKMIEDILENDDDDLKNNLASYILSIAYEYSQK